MTTLFAAGYGATIYTLSFDPSATPPTLQLTSSLTAGNAPTWVCLHPTRPVLYAVDEFAAPTGLISAFHISPTDGSLERFSQTQIGRAHV